MAFFPHLLYFSFKSVMKINLLLLFKVFALFTYWIFFVSLRKIWKFKAIHVSLRLFGYLLILSRMYKIYWRCCLLVTFLPMRIQARICSIIVKLAKPFLQVLYFVSPKIILIFIVSSILQCSKCLRWAFHSISILILYKLCITDWCISISDHRWLTSH